LVSSNELRMTVPPTPRNAAPVRAGQGPAPYRTKRLRVIGATICVTSAGASVSPLSSSAPRTLTSRSSRRRSMPARSGPQPSSQLTRRWSKPDSNSRSHLRRYRCEAQE
jgi:hypothetical protein